MERESRARVYLARSLRPEVSMTRMHLGITAPRSETLSRHHISLSGGSEEESDSAGSALTDALLTQAGDPVGVGMEFGLDSGTTSVNEETTNEPEANTHIPEARTSDSEEGMPDTPLGIYFRDIARVPLLTSEQEVELAQKLERGKVSKAELNALIENGEADEDRLFELESDVARGEDARKVLMESNLRLVVSVARRYLGRGLPFADLIQEGSLGLSRAVEKFDYNRGFKFSTYAYWWIRQAVTRAIANQSRTIRVPVHMIDQIGHVYGQYHKLQQKLGRDPKVEELAKEMGMTVEKVREAFRASANPISLETPVGTDEENTLGDIISDKQEQTPEDLAEHALLADHLDEALEELTSREQLVLKMRFGIPDQRPRTLGEIGKIIGVSRERVRQLEAEAIEKLRRPQLRQRLAEYLE